MQTLLKRFMPIIVKCNLGQPKNGVQYGGHYIYREVLQSLKLCTYFDIKKFTDYKRLYEELNTIKYPLVLGGDHSIGQSSVLSSINKYNDLKVIWIDAHADINTFKSSITKNLHGMPLSGCINIDTPWLGSKYNISKFLDPTNLIYVGIRDLDPFEKDIIKKLNISVLTPNDCIDYIKYNNYKYHVSFDVDALDPKYLDATGTIASHGLTPKNVKNIIKSCGDNLVALDIVEFNPFLGDLDKSTKALEEIFN